LKKTQSSVFQPLFQAEGGAVCAGGAEDFLRGQTGALHGKNFAGSRKSSIPGNLKKSAFQAVRGTSGELYPGRIYVAHGDFAYCE